MRHGIARHIRRGRRLLRRGLAGGNLATRRFRRQRCGLCGLAGNRGGARRVVRRRPCRGGCRRRDRRVGLRLPGRSGAVGRGRRCLGLRRQHLVGRRLRHRHSVGPDRGERRDLLRLRLEALGIEPAGFRLGLGRVDLRRCGTDGRDVEGARGPRLGHLLPRAIDCSHGFGVSVGGGSGLLPRDPCRRVGRRLLGSCLDRGIDSRLRRRPARGFSGCRLVGLGCRGVRRRLGFLEVVLRLAGRFGRDRRDARRRRRACLGVEPGLIGGIERLDRPLCRLDRGDRRLLGRLDRRLGHSRIRLGTLGQFSGRARLRCRLLGCSVRGSPFGGCRLDRLRRSRLALGPGRRRSLFGRRSSGSSILPGNGEPVRCRPQRRRCASSLGRCRIEVPGLPGRLRRRRSRSGSRRLGLFSCLRGSGIGSGLGRDELGRTLLRRGELRNRPFLARDLARDMERLEPGGGRCLRLAQGFRLPLLPLRLLLDPPPLALEALVLEPRHLLELKDLLDALLLADVEVGRELEDVDDPPRLGQRTAEDEADLRRRRLVLRITGHKRQRPVAVDGERVEVDRRAAADLGLGGVEGHVLETDGAGGNRERPLDFGEGQRAGIDVAAEEVAKRVLGELLAEVGRANDKADGARIDVTDLAVVDGERAAAGEARHEPGR